MQSADMSQLVINEHFLGTQSHHLSNDIKKAGIEREDSSVNSKDYINVKGKPGKVK